MSLFAHPANARDYAEAIEMKAMKMEEDEYIAFINQEIVNHEETVAKSQKFLETSPVGRYRDFEEECLVIYKERLAYLNRLYARFN